MLKFFLIIDNYKNKVRCKSSKKSDFFSLKWDNFGVRIVV